jgi:Protein of unknown function (DUF938)
LDARETAPSPERNKQPILEVLARVLPPCGLVLEIGSGTGQHVAHFAKALPALTFQPSEMNVERHPSIALEPGLAGLATLRQVIASDSAPHRPSRTRASGSSSAISNRMPLLVAKASIRPSHSMSAAAFNDGAGTMAACPKVVPSVATTGADDARIGQVCDPTPVVPLHCPGRRAQIEASRRCVAQL